MIFDNKNLRNIIKSHINFVWERRTINIPQFYSQDMTIFYLLKKGEIFCILENIRGYYGAKVQFCKDDFPKRRYYTREFSHIKPLSYIRIVIQTCSHAAHIKFYFINSFNIPYLYRIKFLPRCCC